MRQAEDAAAPQETAVQAAVSSGVSERLLPPPKAASDERVSVGDASRDATGSQHYSRWLQGVEVPRKRAWADDELDFVASDVSGMLFLYWPWPLSLFVPSAFSPLLYG